jgi:hypothetical protein
MNKLLVVGAAFLVLAGCDKPAEAPSTAAEKPTAANVPQHSGQYLRFDQLSDGEPRLEAHRVVGQEVMVISGYSGFAVDSGKCLEVSPLVVAIKNCGVITFRRAASGAAGMSAERTDVSGVNDQCPIQSLNDTWMRLTAGDFRLS